MAHFQFLSSPQCNLLNTSWLNIGFLLHLLWEKITVSLHYFTNILYLFAVWSLTTVLGRGGSCHCVWLTLVCCTATSSPALWQDSPAYAGSNKMTLTSSVPPLMWAKLCRNSIPASKLIPKIFWYSLPICTPLMDSQYWVLWYEQYKHE